MSALPDQAAREVLEVVPLIMRAIRTEMRRQRGPELSVPQFRTLAFLNHNEGASLSEVAEEIGLMLPSMSKLIDGLVGRELVMRKTCSDDRRRVRLSLTEAGRSTLQLARHLTQAYLARRLATLSPTECEAATRAMRTLRPIFTAGQETEAGKSDAG